METFIKKIKTKIILLSLLIGSVIVFTLMSTVNNAKSIKVFFFDLYKNRLVAENYLYTLNSTFSQKKAALLDADLKQKTYIDSFQHDSIRHLLDQFLKTKLTKEEEEVFNLLTKNIQYAENLELTTINDIDKHHDLIAAYDNVLRNLNALSAIQIKEGAILFKEVQKSSSSILIKSDLFWALGLIVLMGVISSIKNKHYRPLKSKHPYSLN